MDRRIVTIPPGLVRLTRIDWDIDWRGQGLGEDVGGDSYTVFNRFPRWTGNPALAANNDAILQWRAVRAQAQGRANIYRVPMVDPLGHRDLIPAADMDLVEQGLPFSGGVRFDGGAGWAYAPAVRCAAAVAAGADMLTVDWSDSPRAPRVGQIMSHNDWPFLVTSVTETDDADVVSMTIQMPLRRAIAEGDLVAQIGCGLFVSASDTAGNPVYDRRFRSRPELQLREFLTRP